MAAILPCFMSPMSQSPSSSPRKGTGVQRGCCTLIDGEHLEVAVCQCDGGVPGPRHSAAGEEEEGWASPATLIAHFCLDRARVLCICLVVVVVVFP